MLYARKKPNKIQICLICVFEYSSLGSQIHATFHDYLSSCSPLIYTLKGIISLKSNFMCKTFVKCLYIFFAKQYFFRVFVNRSLHLEKIKFFGFDMDYTLAGKFLFYHIDA